MALRPARRSAIPAFEVMTILNQVAALRAAGKDVISLCAGEPSGGAPSAVRRRAAEILADRTPLGYTEALGIRPLREAIAGHYKRWYGLRVDPARVAVTTGSSGAFATVFLAAFDVGDRIAMARPGYPAYRNLLRALGCEVVELDCGRDCRFQPTVAQLEEAQATGPLAGLVLASPANPTGTMVSPALLTALGDWCRAHDVRLISDEIYHGITYGGTVGDCAQEYAPGAVVVSSFSKFWGMTGWRLGWAVLPEDLVGPADALAGNLALCPPAPAQYAALEAFTEESYAEGATAVHTFADARAVLLEALPELGWVDVAPADGAFYLYAGVGPRLGPYADSRAWCAALLVDQGVAVTPGVDFDSVRGGSTVRVSLAAGPEAVATGVGRILHFQRGLDG